MSRGEIYSFDVDSPKRREVKLGIGSANSSLATSFVNHSQPYLIAASAAVISGALVVLLCKDYPQAEPDKFPQFRAAPVYVSLCINHSSCPSAHSEKECCPDENGIFLDCCDPIPTAANLSRFYGMCYNPAPIKYQKEMPSDDYMAPYAEALWGNSPQGGSRDDLAIIQKMGASTVRLYGNDPRLDSLKFLDRALELKLDVIVAFSNYPYTQDPERNCAIGLPFDCFDLVSQQFISMLRNGFTRRQGKGYRTYHPAIKAIILMNEPELAMRYKELNNKELRSEGYYTKALLSAFDGALDAEKTMMIVPDSNGFLPPFTVTYSFDICQNCKSAAQHGVGDVNALPFMYDFMLGSLNPSRYGYEARGRVPLKFGLQNRLVLSFNTQDGAAAVCNGVVQAIARSPLRDFLVFIGEFHAPDWSASKLKDELIAMKDYIEGTHQCHGIENPIAGLSLMEFQVSYFKGWEDKQLDYGLYELGKRKLGETTKVEATGWKKYDVWCLHQKRDEDGESLSEAVKDAFGGASVPKDHDCPTG